VERWWPHLGNFREPTIQFFEKPSNPNELEHNLPLVFSCFLALINCGKAVRAVVAWGEFPLPSPRSNSPNSPEHQHICELARTLFGPSSANNSQRI
jgi:hypothetical protein